MEDAGVNGGGEEIVSGGDGVNVAGQVQIEIFHRHDLGVATAGGTALYAKRRAHRGLTDNRNDALVQLKPESLRQTARRRRLAFAQRRRRNRSYVNILAIFAFLKPFAYVQVNFGFVRTKQL